MNILVTGGAGYIGSELVYKLAKRPDVEKVYVYDNIARENHNLFISTSNKIQSSKVEFVFGDILDSRKLKSYIAKVDTVYHLAAVTAVPFQGIESHIYEQINHWGTAEVVYACEEAENVKNIFYLSTIGVYGFSGKEAIVNEDSRLNPRGFYDISKMRAEEHVKRLIGKKEKVVIFRAANVYGYTPAIHFKTVINRFLFDSNFNNRISINGSGKQSRSFVHVYKLVDVMIEGLINNLPSDIYNVADKNYSILDLVDIFKEMYPELEFIFINQHLDLRELVVSLEDQKLSKYIKMPDSDLKEELLWIKETRFAF